MSLLVQGNLDPGRLDRRIVLSYPVETRDALGGSVTSWITAATVWGAKLPAGGGRMYAAEGKHYEQLLTYRLRHRADVAPGWRLTHGDDVFEIAAVAEQGRGHYLDVSLRGVDQTAGAADRGDGLRLEALAATDLLLLENGNPLLLEAA